MTYYIFIFQLKLSEKDQDMGKETEAGIINWTNGKPKSVRSARAELYFVTIAISSSFQQKLGALKFLQTNIKNTFSLLTDEIAVRVTLQSCRNVNIVARLLV